MRPVMVGLVLVDERRSAVPDRDRSDVDQPYVLKPGLVFSVLRTDDWTGDSIATGEVLRGFGSGYTCLCRKDIGTALQS